MGTAEHVIVVGVDGSDSSLDALRWAARQAELTGATLEAVMTMTVPMAVYAAPMPVEVVNPAETKRVLDQLIDSTLGEDPPVKVSATVVEGPPAIALVNASSHADLLVVGSRGHGALAGMLLGSVSEHCIAHASCPVAVIRHRHQSEAK